MNFCTVVVAFVGFVRCGNLLFYEAPVLCSHNILELILRLQVESKKEALMPDLQAYVLKQPCAIVKNLSNALNLDLSLFSTKNLVEAAPSQKIEVRTQAKQRPDDNVQSHSNQRIWYCDSKRRYTTIRTHGIYQAEDFVQALQVELKKRLVFAHENDQFMKNLLSLLIELINVMLCP